MVKFRDRKEAGQRLADLLWQKISDIKNGIVLALPRGGVVVGREVAKKLNLPLDIIVTRKIGAKENPEYAVVAVSAHSIVYGNSVWIDKSYIEEEIQAQREEIERRMREYRRDEPYPVLKGKTVILVDDGLATGLSMQAAIEEVKLRKPAKVILALPVAPPDSLKKIKPMVDETIVLSEEPLFFAVGQFYENFEAVPDEEVKNLLSTNSN